MSDRLTLLAGILLLALFGVLLTLYAPPRLGNSCAARHNVVLCEIR